MSYPTIKVTAAKAKVAAVGATLTAILVALGPLQVALEDDKLDLGEVTTLGGALVTLAATVYGVWRTRNKPVIDKDAGQTQR